MEEVVKIKIQVVNISVLCHKSDSFPLSDGL